MQIAYTGFPGHLGGCRFFPSNRAAQFRPIIELHETCLVADSDADEFLNDGINRLKPGKATLGDDEMRRTLQDRLVTQVLDTAAYEPSCPGPDQAAQPCQILVMAPVAYARARAR